MLPCDRRKPVGENETNVKTEAEGIDGEKNPGLNTPKP